MSEEEVHYTSPSNQCLQHVVKLAVVDDSPTKPRSFSWAIADIWRHFTDTRPCSLIIRSARALVSFSSRGDQVQEELQGVACAAQQLDF